MSKTHKELFEVDIGDISDKFKDVLCFVMRTRDYSTKITTHLKMMASMVNNLICSDDTLVLEERLIRTNSKKRSRTTEKMQIAETKTVKNDNSLTGMMMGKMKEENERLWSHLQKSQENIAYLEQSFLKFISSKKAKAKVDEVDRQNNSVRSIKSSQKGRDLSISSISINVYNPEHQPNKYTYMGSDTESDIRDSRHFHNKPIFKEDLSQNSSFFVPNQETQRIKKFYTDKLKKKDELINSMMSLLDRSGQRIKSLQIELNKTKTNNNLLKASIEELLDLDQKSRKSDSQSDIDNHNLSFSNFAELKVNTRENSDKKQSLYQHLKTARKTCQKHKRCRFIIENLKTQLNHEQNLNKKLREETLFYKDQYKEVREIQRSKRAGLHLSMSTAYENK